MVHKQASEEDIHQPAYGSRYLAHAIPKHKLPDQAMPADVAYQVCHDELQLDGNPPLNLASFVSTWMEPQAEKLIIECLNKNLADEDEYPQTKVIEKRCVSMLAHLFHAEGDGMGTSAIGSSEAIMLAAMSHKRRWKRRREKAGKPTDRPNIVMSANVQVVWDKFANYFEVEPRLIPLEVGHYTLSAQDVAEACDENTICVVAVLGNTFTGDYDPVAEIDAALEKINANTDWDIPLHVDAASGGFVAPFIEPDFVWDFRLKTVQSINVSGHKYGLVYPGVGWVIWRKPSLVPDELIFKVNYLGGEMPTFNLNFSRAGSHVIAQYYNFLRLGRQGYQKIMENLMGNRHYLVNRLERLGVVEVLTHREHSLPLVAMALKEKHPFTLFDVSEALRTRGWIVPAYTLPPDAQEVTVLRVVVRESFSCDMTELFATDLKWAIQHLYARGGQFKKREPCRHRGATHC